MSRSLDRLAEDRAVRDAAHGVFRADLERVRGDLTARGIAGRVADSAGEKAHEALEVAVEVASEHKSVVAGTLTALLLWIFRNPLIDAVTHLLGRDDDDDEAQSGKETDQ